MGLAQNVVPGGSGGVERGNHVWAATIVGYRPSVRWHRREQIWRGRSSDFGSKGCAGKGKEDKPEGPGPGPGTFGLLGWAASVYGGLSVAMWGYETRFETVVLMP